MNSKFLVALQFVSIGVIMIPKKSIMITPYWWVLPLVATGTGLWIFMHNKLGNFNVIPEIREKAKLIVTGPYRYVRHPMYSSLILFMLGIVLWHFTWINVGALSIMIVAVALKAFKEESLWVGYHDDYASYQKRTKMILPFIL
jgi:protein-S-isoprenylcysteine O-methyltransferase Ste14